jgi:hypothetical protein
MTDRATSLTALRPSRSTALPPPPTLARQRQTHDDPPVPDPRQPEPSEENSPAQADDAAAATPAAEVVQPATAAGRRPRPSEAKDEPTATSTAVESSNPVRSGFDRLVADPVDACRTMGMLREGQPSKPLNVDLTPGVAGRFDDRCRALRVKKKDVVELLLRAWLDQPNE